MRSEKDFIDLYRKYNDQELAEVYTNIEGYSEEAKNAIYTVIQEKGGIDRLLESLKNKLLIDKEISRIKNETQQLSRKETNADFIKTLITSAILPRDQVEKIIDENFEIITGKLAADSFSAKTIMMAGLGIVASITAGILWGLLANGPGRVPLLLIATVIAVPYFIILLFTRKSKANPVVLISTLIAVGMSFFISRFFY